MGHSENGHPPNMSDHTQGKTPAVSLNPEDAQILEIWMASSWSPSAEEVRGQSSQPTAEQSDRADKLGSLLGLLDQYPVPQAQDDLTQRTVEQILASEQRQRFAEQLQAVTAPTPAFRWSELTTVAAVLMIALSLLWPFLSYSRTSASRVACANQLASAGMGFGRYATDYGGVLPRRGSFPGNPWYHVGEPPETGRPIRSNSAHLAVLINGAYVHPNTLACPDNKHAPRDLSVQIHDWPSAKAISFSYQNQFTRTDTQIDRSPQIAILADKNPFIVVVEGFAFRPDQLPLFHRQLGQNVLRANGAVQWTTQPLINGDNFYLASGIDHYQGNEVPASDDDAMLVP